MLALEVSEEELVHRLMHRGKSSGRSDDADELIIRNRIREYENKASAWRWQDYYASGFGKVVHVPGEGGIDDIFKAICAQVKWAGKSGKRQRERHPAPGPQLGRCGIPVLFAAQTNICLSLCNSSKTLYWAAGFLAEEMDRYCMMPSRGKHLPGPVRTGWIWAPYWTMAGGWEIRLYEK